jgi:serine/threonine-protein kinase
VPGLGIKLETGHVLDDRYLLEKVIGEGGMGTVFAARHLELGDIVAVKVLQSDAAITTLPEENIERFLREARLAVKIKNEHVVRILDVARGKHGSPPYIVMELLEGIDLGDLVRTGGRIRVSDAVDYVLQACEALAEAHALGIVHRDLKSSNLHLSKRVDGSPLIKVLDFGISKAHDEKSDVNLTSTSAVFGSPAYMSPEQIRSAKHVDLRTDVWALNVVLYELLTAELPFVGDTAPAMLASISADPYVPVRKHVFDAPPELERAIHAAFVKDREKRTPSIPAFAESIAPFGGPNASASVTAIHRAAQRSSTRSVSSSGSVGIVPPPSSPRAVSETAPVSDTMRAGLDTGSPITAPIAPIPAASARSDEVGRTDREMVVPATNPGKSSFIPILAVALAISLGVLGLGVVAFLRSRHRGPEFPATPVVVTVTVTVPSPPPPPPDPVPPPVVSLELPVTPNVPRKLSGAKPHVTHAPSAAAAPLPKPTNGIPDTSHRE